MKNSIIISISLAVIFVSLLGIIYTKNLKKQTTIAQPQYTCPSNEYIDCQPIILPEKKYLCEQPYLDWVKANCPNFKGVAY